MISLMNKLLHWLKQNMYLLKNCCLFQKLVLKKPQIEEENADPPELLQIDTPVQDEIAETTLIKNSAQKKTQKPKSCL